MWPKLTGSVTFVTLRICRQSNLATLRPHIRSISHGSSCLDSRTQTIQPLCSRSGHPSITPALGLQPRRTITTDRSSWYESIADSTPVCLTEQLLESTQQMTGLPWWASIVCTTLTLRTAITLPLGIYQSIIIAKVLLDHYSKRPFPCLDLWLRKILLVFFLAIHNHSNVWSR